MPEGRLHFASGRDYLHIEPTRRAYAEAADYWDGNWIYADVAVRAGAFQGAYEALLRADEFHDFRHQLAVLYEALSGVARFEAMENWVRVHIAGDGRGHFLARCTLRDNLGMGNELNFGLEFDQTAIPKMLQDLDRLLHAFPVKGSSADR